MSIKLSVIMPALNEEATIETCIVKANNTCREMGISYEVIVVDNGSTDSTVNIAVKHGAKVVHQSIKGYGAAYIKGFESANGEYIIMGDSDDSYDFNMIMPFIQKLDEGFDMVMGNRFKGGIEKGAMPWHHKYIGNPILTAILKFLFRAKISDAHCGMRGFRKNIIKKLNLKTSGMEFASEMIIKAAQANIKLTEIPIILHKDGRLRKPHLRSFRDGWRHLRFMLLYAPMHLFFIPGSILFITGMIIVATLGWGPISIGKRLISYHTLVFGSIMTILGYQIIFQGITIRAYSLSQEFLIKPGILNRFVKKFTLEKGIIIGLLTFFIGVITELVILVIWIKSNFAQLNAIYQALFGLTFITLGVQTIFSSFFISSFNIKKIYNN